MSAFGRLAPRLQDAIVARLGWSSLRPVQELATEALLDGKNAVVLAPTAGGKTEAAFFPLLSKLVEKPIRGVQVIYVAPIKALLNNQADRLGLYTEMVGLRRFVWHGDVTTSMRKGFKKSPTELLMTTPESLEVMLDSEHVDEQALFADVRAVVIDEVHDMAGEDRGAHLMSVIERLTRLTRFDIQRVGLSATVGNPANILEWLQGTSKREAIIIDPPREPQKRELLVIHDEDTRELARTAARMAVGQKSLFFCQSRAMTESVAEAMGRGSTEVLVHHSSVSREERLYAEIQFHDGKDVCIVCTSTLELGIDVGDLDRIFQAEAPATVSSFMQRMGRTGRREGQVANTTFFCEKPQGVLQAIALIELAKQGFIEDVQEQRRCWPVVIHQLLALALGKKGVTIQDAWDLLEGVPDFADIERAEFDRLISWMLKDEALILTAGRLILGPKSEKMYGRRNFSELYAVFSSPQVYTVFTVDGRPIGSLQQNFVDGLVEQASCFLLAGRPWLVSSISHNERQIRVSQAPRGREPTWGGFMPQYLSFEVCQRILGILCSSDQFSYLDETAAKALATEREFFADTLKPEDGGIEFDDGEIRWWTFAGGRVNATLKYAILAKDPELKVIPDNFLLKLRGDHLDQQRFHELVEGLRDPEYWGQPGLWREVAEGLPNYRMSKFQPVMPPWVVQELLATNLLAVEEAWAWLNRGRDAAMDQDVLRLALRGAPEFRDRQGETRQTPT